MTPRRMTAALLVTALILVGGCRPKTGSLPEPVQQSYDETLGAGWWAEAFDAWRQEIDLAGTPPTYSDLGGYPIGNGRVFAISGLSVPLGTVQDMLGPIYQKVSGLMGSVMPSVLVGGEPILLPQQTTEWIAPGGVVHTRWAGGPVRVDIFQTVPPDLDAVLSLIAVSSESKEALRNVALGLEMSLPAEPTRDGALLHVRGDTRMRVGFAGGRTRVEDRSVLPPLPEGLSVDVLPFGPRTGQQEDTRSVICPLGTLKPGGWSLSLAYATFVTGPQAEADEARIVAAVNKQAFDDSHQWWADWSDRTVTVEGAGDEIDQFLAIEKYICRVQQAERGGFSPMHKYTYRWIRDANGPIECLLDFGDQESVARDLAFHFAGCAVTGEIGNNLPLNLDVSAPPEVDWATMPSPKAEIASFVILQNAWYWRHTGETAQLEERWDYLRRALDGQDVDEEGRLPFYGDETYRFPGYELYKSDDTACPDYVDMTLRSADSAFEYVAAAEAMAQMARAIGRDDEVADYEAKARRVREATERFYRQRERGYYAPAMSALSGELYRPPFANIDLRPLWIGYAEPDDEQTENVLSALSYLYRPDTGTTRTTPQCEYYVGMTPGYVLSALSRLDHPAAEGALRGLLASAETSGGFAEMNRPDDTPSRDVWGLHRDRPWEGGINASAVLQYLTGFAPDAPNRTVRFAPHLPADSMLMTVSNLRVGEARLKLMVALEVGRVKYVVECVEANEPVEVELVASAPGSELSAVEGNWRELDGRTREMPARFGRAHVLIRGAKLEAGKSLEVTVEAAGMAEPAELTIAGEPFDWGDAKVRRGATVLVTWSEQVAEAVRAQEGSVTVVDTRVAWPAAYLRSALMTEDGAPRAAKVILDVTGWPGAFKPRDFWTGGEGAAVIADYTAAGGTVEQAAVAGAGQAAPEGLIN